MMAGGEASRILVLGRCGMLGRDLVAALEASGRAFRAVDREECDITRRRDVARALDQSRAEIIINAAGWTDVDGAESHPEAANLANHVGPANLAAACAARGSRLVHVSTDYVFDGRAKTPISVDAPTNPINAYGRTKRAGEEAIRASACQHLIIRTSGLYAEHGKNFVRTIRDAARTRGELRVVNDQTSRPTYTRDLARIMLRMIDAGATGTRHVANEGSCTWFDFARAIVELSGISCQVHPCTSAQFPRPARRPAYSVLDIEPARREFGPIRHWREALAECIEELEKVERAAVNVEGQTE